jgi:hypothetical protein
MNKAHLHFKVDRQFLFHLQILIAAIMQFYLHFMGQSFNLYFCFRFSVPLV